MVEEIKRRRDDGLTEEQKVEEEMVDRHSQSLLPSVGVFAGPFLGGSLEGKPAEACAHTQHSPELIRVLIFTLTDILRSGTG